MCAAIWLMGQCSVFVRNREQFRQPPFNLKIDEAFVYHLKSWLLLASCRSSLNS